MKQVTGGCLFDSPVKVARVTARRRGAEGQCGLSRCATNTMQELIEKLSLFTEMKNDSPPPHKTESFPRSGGRRVSPAALLFAF